MDQISNLASLASNFGALGGVSNLTRSATGSSIPIQGGSSSSFIFVIIVVIILMLCCSSSAAAAFYFRKKDDTTVVINSSGTAPMATAPMATAPMATAPMATAPMATAPPNICIGDSLWGNQAVASGGKISRTCPDGTSIFATCGSDGNFSDVQNCPVKSSADSIRSPNCITDTCITSSNGKFKMCQQKDGNLVLYKGEAVIWSSDRYGGDKVGGRLCMQADGNLVGYTAAGKAYWEIFTNGKGLGPYRATMQDDGNFVVYDTNNAVSWSTGTNGR